MIRSKRFFAKRLKRVLITANRAVYNSSHRSAPGECELCGGSGLANKGLMEVCNFCNGTGILSPRTQSPRRAIISRNPVDQIIEDFEELSSTITRRYLRVATHYRDW